jgi:segregation and condensation protein A
MQMEDSPYTVTLGVFEGPLDLLLHLIRENEIDIYDIPIAKVTEQYLAYLSLMESLDLDVAGEWLVMAATLLEIKSRMLLPEDPQEQPDEEPVDPRLELVERLIEYEKFKGAAEIFREKEAERSRVFARGAVELEFDLRPKFDLSNITAVDLLAALQKILLDTGEDEPVTSIQRRKVSVRMRMREVWRKIETAGKLVFDELFEGDRNRVEIVITFLALLELLKQHKVTVKQTRAFAPIQIVPVMETNGS